MNKRSTKPRNSKEFTISVSELSKFGSDLMTKASKVIDTAKKGKITIRLEK